MSRPEEHEWSNTTGDGYVAGFSRIYSVTGPDGTKKLTLEPCGRVTRRQEDNSRVRFLSQEEEAAISKQLRERYPNFLNIFIPPTPEPAHRKFIGGWLGIATRRPA